GETLRLDEHGHAYPPEAENEIAEAEPPADDESRQEPTQETGGRIGGRSVQQPYENRGRDKAGSEEDVGRHRGNGHGARQKGRGQAPPAGEQDHLAGQALDAVASLVFDIRNENHARRLPAPAPRSNPSTGMRKSP